jgi:uncharacterized protein (TIGR02444 family)
LLTGAVWRIHKAVLLPLRSRYSTNCGHFMDPMKTANDRTPPAGAAPLALGDAFWRFSLALYARPGVAEALIGLQDRAGCEVNLILFALWAGVRHGRLLGKTGLAAAAAASAEPSAVAASIRRLRRQLADPSDSAMRRLRRGLLAVELAAERRVQDRLAAFAAAWTPAAASGGRRAIADTNLALCLGDETHSPEAAVLRRQLGALMRQP